MKTSYIVGIVIVILVIGGIVWYSKSNSGSPSTAQQTSTGENQTQPAAQSQISPTQTGQAVPSAPAAATPAPQSFAVNGNDESADLTTITVPKGTPVTITFGADAGTTYHGGLDFRSSVVNTGTITPGSTKTVTFTATQSFSFTPYWPATNIAKPYKINIVVQ